jgi:flagellar biogenesis protein FliO
VKTLTLLLLSLTSFNLHAQDVSIKGAELKSDKGPEAKLSIKHIGTLNDNPKITVSDKVLQVSIPNSTLGNKIFKRVNGAAISATQLGEDTVNLKVVLPYSLKGKEQDVTITLKEGAIDVNFPRIEVAKKALVARAPGIVEEPQVSNPANEANNAEAEKLDENYLSKISNEHEKLAAEKHPESEIKATTQAQADTDRVSLTQAGVAKSAGTLSSETTEEPKSRFSIVSYVGKFVAFLAIMIAGFYGVLTLFKKGVIKKGKLGFLHSTKLVEVLSTTHVAPKRSLIMIKAHKQVFLVSNSETGMQLISEIRDVTGIIKTGEEEITGSNFDTNLISANRVEKQFKIKEDVVASDYGDDYAMDSLDDMLNDTVPSKTERRSTNSSSNSNVTNAARSIEKSPVVDQVRFSDQIKTKVKNLKQL